MVIKIEPVLIIFLIETHLEVEMNHCLKRKGIDNSLNYDKIYALETETYIYIGTYEGIIRDSYGYVLCLLSHVIKKDKTGKSLSEKIKGVSYFSREYTFYDVEEIRDNGKKARQSMEKRSLDLILKKIINENFEWS